MLLADGDILKADAYAKKDVVEFWGYVWEFQERLKKKASKGKPADKDEYDAN